MDRAETINRIQAEDRNLGVIAKETENAYQNGNSMAALSSLFTLMEQATKFAVEETGGKSKEDPNFHECIEEASGRGIIDGSEEDFLKRTKKFRNKIFHENLDKWSFTDDEGVVYPLSEASNRKILYESKSEETFRIILKLLMGHKE